MRSSISTDKELALKRYLEVWRRYDLLGKQQAALKPFSEDVKIRARSVKQSKLKKPRTTWEDWWYHFLLTRLTPQQVKEVVSELQFKNILYGDEDNKTRISGLLHIDPENMDKIQPPMEPMDTNLRARITLLLGQYILNCIINTLESFDERVYTFLLRMGADPTESIESLLYALKLNFFGDGTFKKPRFDKMFQIVKKVLQHPQTSFQGIIQKWYKPLLIFDKFYGNPTDTDDKIKVNQTLKKELHQIRQLYRKKRLTSIRQVLFGDEDTTLRLQKLVARKDVILPYTQSIKQMKKTPQQMIRLNMLVPELIKVDHALSESILQFLLDIGADPNHSGINGTK